MKAVLFDLGNTLEENDVLLPDALETLEEIAGLRSTGGEPAALGLVSDFLMPEDDGQIAHIRQEYFAILESLGIRSFFEPVERRVTLSTEVGVFKPDERIFRAALDKIEPNLAFADAMFITENPGHVNAARQLGMVAVAFRGPEATGGVARLLDLIPRVVAFLG
ncbi:MAG: hypothetical protein ABUT39_02335 [Acidobacteriota bacterium]